MTDLHYLFEHTAECPKCGWRVSTTRGAGEARNRVVEHIEQDHGGIHE